MKSSCKVLLQEDKKSVVVRFHGYRLPVVCPYMHVCLRACVRAGDLCFLFQLRGLDSNVAVTNVCPGPVITDVDVNSLRGSGETHGREDAMIRGGMTAER